MHVAFEPSVAERRVFGEDDEMIPIRWWLSPNQQSNGYCPPTP